MTYVLGNITICIYGYFKMRGCVDIRDSKKRVLNSL